MFPVIITVSLGEPVEDAAKLLDKNHICALDVIDEERRVIDLLPSNDYPGWLARLR